MLDEVEVELMWQAFRGLRAKALSMSHYELSAYEDIKFFHPDKWREFLFLPDVNEYVKEETALLHDVELRKLLANISTSRSVGQAQLISQLQKIVDGNTNKSGPIFIYTYVPLNEAQKHASNAYYEEKDVFWRE